FSLPSKRRRSRMRTRMGIGIISLLAVQTVCVAAQPITSNPLPEPIVKRGIAVEAKDLARLPDTRGLRPADQDIAPHTWARVSDTRGLSVADQDMSPDAWARVSFVRSSPDGRLFANDSRGLLYLIGS